MSPTPSLVLKRGGSISIAASLCGFLVLPLSTPCYSFFDIEFKKSTRPAKKETMSTADSETDSLRDWYSEYQADDWPGPRSPSLASVTTDLLNHADIAKKVHSLVRATTVKSGFCNGCTRLLVHWPTPQWRPFIPCFGKPCPTIEMEAGARAGCRFCALLFSKLYQTGLLNFFREVERRLFILKIDATPSLTIAATSEHVQQLWVDYPEKFTRRLPVHSPVSLLKSTIQPPNCMCKTPWVQNKVVFKRAKLTGEKRIYGSSQ